MATYAANTTVDAGKSRADIERTLTRFGADSFAYGWQGTSAMVGFTAHGRQIRFVLPMPDRTAPEFTRTPTGRSRSVTEAEKAYEQAVRQKWRALLLIIKAKLEAVESQIVTFEEEFATHTVLPDGRTVAEHLMPAIEQSYASGRVSPLLQIEN